MSAKSNQDIANAFLAKLGSEASPDEIAALFTENLAWNIPGDVGALPWLGRKIGRSAVADFVRDTRTMIERMSLAIHDVLASEARAVILGELKSRVNHTGKLIETPFAIALTFIDGKIASYVMLEDSFTVSQAARAQTSS
ncbi:nuclear transport factor 2 family protein [Dyella silvatica]|uniref:nuclear transport factor 2 family protein n=1 Tax=Dyella silvatica TaxID=2992128 RepID=UPI00224E3518|nr:nuclear transport factor 2 family protein [Dyella silvatica]